MLPTIRPYYRKEREKNGAAPLTVIATYKGKRVFYSTGIKVPAENWDEQNRKIIGKKAQMFNIILQKKLDEVNQAYLIQAAQGEEIHLQKKEAKISFNFNGYATKYLEDLTNKVKRSTIQSYTSAIDKFKLIAGNISFNQISIEVLQNFENEMYKDGLGSNRVYKVFAILRQIAKDAERLHKIDISAWKNYKVAYYEQPVREFLTPEQILEIENMEGLSQMLNNVRNWFLISCYTGFRYSDLGSIKENVRESAGIKRIILPTQKTGDMASIKVTDKVQKLLDSVNRLPTNQICNKALKVIGSKMKPQVLDLNFHRSRHSFATTLLMRNVDIATISKLLTHTNIKTTQIYAKVINKTMDDALDLL